MRVVMMVTLAVPLTQHATCPLLCRSHVGLPELLRSPRTVLLFPGPGAVDVAELVKDDHGGGTEGESQEPLTVLILDGTWRQAKTMYTFSPALHSVRQVR